MCGSFMEWIRRIVCVRTNFRCHKWLNGDRNCHKSIIFRRSAFFKTIEKFIWNVCIYGNNREWEDTKDNLYINWNTIKTRVPVHTKKDWFTISTFIVGTNIAKEISIEYRYVSETAFQCDCLNCIQPNDLYVECNCPYPIKWPIVMYTWVKHTAHMDYNEINSIICYAHTIFFLDIFVH